MLRLDYLSCVLTILSTVLVGKKLWQGWVVAGVNSIIICIIGYANGGIRIRPRQSLLHRTLCKQFLELAAESPGCESSIPPAIPYLIARPAVRARP